MHLWQIICLKLFQIPYKSSWAITRERGFQLAYILHYQVQNMALALTRKPSEILYSAFVMAGDPTTSISLFMWQDL